MKIAIIGITGRMGRAILEASTNQKYNGLLQITYGYAKGDTPDAKGELTNLASKYSLDETKSNNLEAIIESVDAVIDFSAPDISVQAIKVAAKYNKIFISGTTGFTNIQFSEFQSIGKETITLWASNMSIGVNVMNILTEQAARMLEGYDAEILEMHHRNKKDSPSGTAITLGKHVAKARNLDFDKHAVKSREGIAEDIRANDDIGFATLRGGSVIGDHSVIFAGNNDTITLSHQAQDRSIFACGALDAALWCQNKNPGFYSIKDMLVK
ncbi:MAG: 4-hydroxy-tetrahydrodipicolinate reductase [Rickettsiales bacterium]|mgnify:CR=1 FL=1|jgi:4-hydroxy-tetrahydrodipicolinate reductase|nr:4-hydroxy-tetrahydrodipicolinate reductase [Rickettsiales bacterium]